MKKKFLVQCIQYTRTLWENKRLIGIMASTKKNYYLSGKSFLPARVTAQKLACAPDYVGKLCRDGKLDCARVDGAWLVEETSMAEFEKNRRMAKIVRAEELSLLRQQENTLRRKMLSTKHAAQALNCAPDYIGKLCREGKLEGTRVRNAWFVSADSLARFEAERDYSKALRAEELRNLRRSEIEEYRSAGEYVHVPEEDIWDAPFTQKKYTPQTSNNFTSLKGATFVFGVIFLFSSVVFAGGGFANTSVVGQNVRQMAAALAQLESPFFGTRPTAIEFQVTENKPSFFTRFFAFLFEPSAPKVADTLPVRPVPVTSAPAQQGAAGQTIVNNTTNNYTTTNNNTNHNTSNTYNNSSYTIASAAPDGTLVTKEFFDKSLERVFDVIARNNDGGGISTITDADVPDDITASNYLALSGGTLTGAVDNTSTATSTFAGGLSVGSFAVSSGATSTFGGGIDIDSGCFSINGACLGATTVGGSNGQIQFNNGGTLGGSSNLTFDSGTGLLGFGSAVGTAATTTSFFSTTSSSTNLFTSNFSIGSLTGLLQANSGVVTSSSTLSVGYGGTGTSTAPVYGSLLVGNGLGGYSFFATSSLGITPVWGNIGGTLSNQTDLQTALDSKLSLTTWFATTTDVLDEGLNNLYFTQTRARGALSGASVIAYDNTTGVITTQGGTFGSGSYIFPSNMTVNGNSSLGTVTSGIWNGSAISSTYGGTGITSVTQNQLLIGAGGNAWTQISTSSLGVALSDTIGTLSVARGGTGSTTLTGLLVGNGTGSLLTATLSSPLSFSGSTLSISQASDSVNGYLSNTNWSLFNNKVSSTSIDSSLELLNLLTDETGSGNAVFSTDARLSSTTLLASTLLTNATSTTFNTGLLGVGGSSYFTSLLGTGLTNTSGALTVTLAPFSTTNLSEGSNLYFTDVRVGEYISSSSTIPHMGGTAYGDLLRWTGSTWTTAATSTLGVALSDTTGTLTAVRGGTGLSSFTTGDILYADSGSTLTRLPVGAAGQVLKVQAGLPSWGVDQTIGGGGSDGIFATSSGRIYPLDTASVVLVGTDATSTSNSIFEVSGQQYISTRLAIATTAPSVGAALAVGGSGYLTGGLGVGVLNTNAGTLQTSGNAAIGGSLTLGSALAAQYGGTGSTTLTGLLVGNGTGSLLTATVSGPLAFSGSTLSITQSTNSTNGFLTSADWTTFNNKISSSSLAQIFPFTPQAWGNSTSTLIGFNNGILVNAASSTITGGLTLNGALGISGAITSTATTPNTLPYASTTALTVSGNAYFPGSGIWNSSGNVGIGTTTPGAKLHVEATNSSITSGSVTPAQVTGLFTTNTAQGVDVGGSIGLGGLTDSSGTQRMFGAIAGRKENGTNAHTSGYLSFYTHLTSVGIGERMRITSTGNVGIGTTTPGQMLSVAGDILGNNIIGSYFTSTSTTASTFAGAITSTATAANTLPYASSTALTVSGTGYFGTATTTALNVSGTATFQSLASTLLSTNSSGAAQVTTVSGPLAFSGSTLSITQATNAADGYLSSTDWTHFNNKISSTSLSGGTGISYNSTTGVISATNAFPFVQTTFGSTNANSTSTLIGFSNGIYALASSTIGGGTQITGLTISGGATTTGNAYFGGTGRFGSTLTLAGVLSCTGSQALQTNSAGDISCGSISLSGASTGGGWTTNSIGSITLATTSDRVGIGATSTPYAKLSILSGATGTTTLALLPFTGQTANILDIYNTSGALSSVFTASGRLGLGTTSPSQTLSVDGGATVSGNLGIGTTSPYSKLSVVGGNITQVAAGAPTFATSTPSGDVTYLTYVAGNYAYVADNGGGLKILDVTNPKKPTVAGVYSAVSTVRSVVVAGKYAYVADSDTGLKILDVSNPSSPTLVGTYASAGRAFTIALSGRYVFLPDVLTGTLRIVDVANPTNPTLVGSYVTNGVSGEPYAIAVSGKYAYLGDQGTNRIYVLDISNPTNPTLVSSYSSGVTAPTNIYLSGKYAYVSDAGGGFYILDTSNPAALSLVGSYSTSASYYAVQVAGGYAYVADNVSGTVVVLDVSSVTSPTLVGAYSGGTAPRGIFISGKYVYVADLGGGLKVLDINGIQAPTASIGAIQTSMLNVADNINVGGDIYAGGGLNVGLSGIFSRGGLASFGSSTLATTTVSALTVTGLNGTLHATNGIVSATSTLSAQFGGTGSTTLTGLLVGNGTGSLLTATVSGPLAFSGSTLSITQANSSTNGYLSSSDWTTFNNKISSSSLSGGTGISYNSTTGVISSTVAFPFTSTTNFGATANSTSTPIWFTNGFQASSTSRFVDAHFFGDVGIGNTAPENTLHISTTSAGVVTNGLLLQNRSSTLGTGVSLNFISSATAFSDNRYNSITSINTDGGTASALTFSTANSTTPAERLRITASGNVGIGTTTPGQKLSVAGDILGNRIIGSNFISTSTTASTFAGVITSTATSYNTLPYASSTALTVSGAGYFGTASTTNLTISSIASGSLLKTTTAGSVTAAVAGTDYVTPGSLSSSFPFTPQAWGNSTSTLIGFNNGILVNAASSTITGGLTLNGALGISGAITSTATTPNTLPYASTTALTVSGNAYFPGSGIWNSSGNVGIGTTTPVTQLDIENMSATSTFRLFGANTYGAKLSLYENANAASGLGGFGFDIFYDGAANALSFTTVESGTPTLQALTLRRSNGNVGIGTSTPGQKLSVAGDILGNNIIGSYFTSTSTTASTFAGVITSTATSYNTFPYASTTAFTASGTGYFGNIINNGLSANQLVYTNNNKQEVSVATSTATLASEFTYGGTLGSLVGGASGTLSLTTNGVALTKLAQIAANSVLVNNTSATGNVTAISTSTLFGTGTGGKVLTWNAGQPQWVATNTYSGTNGLTTSFSNNTLTVTGVNAAADGSTKGVATFTAADFDATSGLISIDYTNGQAASPSNKGFLTSADWTHFNNKISSSSLAQIFPFTPTTNFGAAANSTSTPIWFTNGIQASSTSQFVNANFFGNVGIGTSTPEVGLSINGADSYGLLHLTNTSSNGTASISFRSADDANGATSQWLIGKNLGGLTSDQFCIWNGSIGCTAFTMQTNGNVGIGTTTPLSLLNVAGATAPKITISDTNASTDQKHWFVESNTGVFSIGTTSDALATNATYRAFAIDASGNIGVGTVAPAAKFQVEEGATADATFGIYNSSSGNGYLAMSANLSAGAYSGLVAAGDKSLIFTNGSSDTGNLVIAPWGTSSYGIKMLSTGLIGVNDSTPTYSFDVTGNARFTSLVDAARFVATSTTASSFPYASSTALSVSGTGYFGTANISGLTASRLVATDANKNLASTITLANLASSISDVTGTTGTGNLALSIGPTFTGTANFANIGVSGNSTLGTVTSGIWNGSAIGGTYGGTGLTSVTQNNLLIGGAGNTWTQVATSSLGIALADTTGTLPVNRGGTGATTLTGLLIGNGTSAFTGTTASGDIATALSDETGSGSLVFSAAPTFTGTAIFAGARINGTVTMGGGTGSTTMGLDQGFSAEFISVSSTSVPYMDWKNWAAEDYDFRMQLDPVQNRFEFHSSTTNNVLSIKPSNVTIPFASTTALSVEDNAYFANNGIWDSSGNVGIGTSTIPGSAVLAVAGNAHLTGKITASSTAPTFVGSIADTGSLDGVEGIAVQGNYIYTASFGVADAFTVIDATDPSNPVIVASTTLGADSGDVIVNGKYAYVAVSGADSLKIIDISNPTNPTIIGTFTSSTQFDLVENMYLSGKYIYGASIIDDMLSIIDISDPTKPTFVGSVASLNTDLNDVRDVVVQGRYAYLAVRVGSDNAASGSHLSVVDVSNPTAPVLLSSTASTTSMWDARGLTVAGRYAYVASLVGDSLTIYDISNPLSPTLTGSVTSTTTLDGAYYVEVRGKYAYVSATTDNMVTVVDVSNPASPFVVASYASATAADNIAHFVLSGRYLYLTAPIDDMVSVLDIGSDLPALFVGDLAASNLAIQNLAAFGSDVTIGGGLTLGGSLSNVGGIASYLFSTSTSAATTTGSALVINHTGITTSGTDNTYGVYASTTRTGATGGTVNTYGGYFKALGDTAGAGTSNVVGLYATAAGGDNNYAAIFDQGNVGIGTTTPGSLLSLGGIANFTAATSTFYSSGGLNLAGGCYAISGTCLTVGSFGGTLAIANGGTNATTQTTNGVNYFNGTSITSGTDFNYNGTNVGIGSTSPSKKLTVLGSSVSSAIGQAPVRIGVTTASSVGLELGTYGGGFAMLQGLQHTTNAAGMVLLNPFGGSVGVGTTTNSDYTFSVTGTNYVTGATTLGSTLSVSGATTMASTLGISGAITSTATSYNTFPYASTTAFTVSGDAYFDNGTGVWNSSGRLGVGTTSPAQELSVTGDGYFTGQVFGNINDSVSAPSFSWLGDENTGLFHPTTNSMAFVTAGTEKIRIDASGNLGIGTTSPASLLQLTGGTSVDQLRLSSSNGASYWSIGRNHVTDGSLTFSGNQNANVIFNTSGKVGIGTTTPNSLLTLQAAAGSAILRINATNASGDAKLSLNDSGGNEYTIGRDTTTGFLDFSGTQTTFSGYKWRVNNGTEVMRITNGGNVGIGTTTPLSLLNVAGATAPKITISDTNASTDQKHWFVESSSGVFSIGTTSDALATNATYRPFSINSAGTVSFPYASTTAISASGQFFGNTSDAVSTPAYSWGGDTTTGIYNSAASQVGIAGAGLQLANFKAGTTTLNIYANNSTLGEIRLGRTDNATRYNTIRSMVGTTATDNFIDFYLHNLTAASNYTSVNSILKLNGNGRVGISSTTPLAKLSVHANANDGAISRNLFTIASSTATATTTLFNIDNIGNVGIGTSTPWATLSINPNGILGPSFVVGSSTATSLVVFNNGKVGIGTTTASSTMLLVGNSSVVGSVAAFGNSTGICFINPTTTSLSCSSDERLKKNITALSPALTGILALNPVTYNWNTETGSTTPHSGFIAQQVEPIFSDLVMTDSNSMKSMNYAGLTPYLVSAIKEINGAVDIAGALTGSATIKSVYAGTHDAAISVDAQGNIGLGAYGAGVLMTDEDGNVRASSEVTDRIGMLESLMGQLQGMVSTTVATSGDDVATSSTATSTPLVAAFTQTLLEALSALGVTLENGIIHFMDLFADHITTNTLTVGSAERPAGITLFDKVTGEPYCFEVVNGEGATTPGECVVGDLTSEPDTELQTQTDTSTSTPLTTEGGEGEVATTTTEMTDEGVASSTPTTSGSEDVGGATSGSNTDTTTQADAPVDESAAPVDTTDNSTTDSESSSAQTSGSDTSSDTSTADSSTTDSSAASSPDSSTTSE